MNKDGIRLVVKEFKRLKDAGHTVTLDGVTDSNDKIERITVVHYLTCQKCQDGRKVKP
jgi:hypothetical protein